MKRGRQTAERPIRGKRQRQEESAASFSAFGLNPRERTTRKKKRRRGSLEVLVTDATVSFRAPYVTLPRRRVLFYELSKVYNATCQYLLVRVSFLYLIVSRRGSYFFERCRHTLQSHRDVSFHASFAERLQHFVLYSAENVSRPRGSDLGATEPT